MPQEAAAGQAEVGAYGCLCVLQSEHTCVGWCRRTLMCSWTASHLTTSPPHHLVCCCCCRLSYPPALPPGSMTRCSSCWRARPGCCSPFTHQQHPAAAAAASISSWRRRSPSPVIISCSSGSSKGIWECQAQRDYQAAAAQDAFRLLCLLRLVLVVVVSTQQQQG